MKVEEVASNPIVLKDLLLGYRARLNSYGKVFGPYNAEVCPAEMVGVIGRNGIGKSTLLRTIAGLQPRLKGDIFIHGLAGNRISLKEMARMVSFVSTEPIQVIQMRVDELVAMGRFPYTGWLGKLTGNDRKAIHQAVEQTGVAHLLNRSIHELSDGERQKVMIARALAQDTPVIILDEPTAFLDLPSRYEILRLLSDLTVLNNKTILFSTHDLSIAMDIADKLWLMADNDIFQGAPEDLLINKVFRKLFLNSPAEFDLKTSTFRFSRIFNRQLEIRGDRKYRLLTRRAMERIGFQISDGETDIVIDLIDRDGKPAWDLIHHKLNLTFDSIYALVTHLKQLNKHP